MAEILGIAGAALIVVAWAVALRMPPPPVGLSGLYAVGSLLLTLYAIKRGDPIFTLLNGLAFILAVVNVLRVRGVYRAGGLQGQGVKRGGEANL